MNRDMLARRLARKGYVIGLAGKRARFAATLSNKTPWIWCVLDIEMPEVSGLDALKTLRELYSPAELPIIMVHGKKHRATTLLKRWIWGQTII